MVAMLAGCSAALGIEDLHPPTIHGVVRDLAASNVPNVSVVLYREPDGARLDEATTDGQGRFEFPIAGALPVNVYLDLADAGFVRTVNHLSQPVVDHSDVDVELLTLTTAGLRMLASDAHATQDPARSVVVAQVIVADGSAVAGATVHARAGDPGTDVPQICYTDTSVGSPCAPGATRDDGLAWLFDVPQTASLTITAMDGGGHSYVASLSVVPGPGLVFVAVRPPS
jgi:hypothetical protein